MLCSFRSIRSSYCFWFFLFSQHCQYLLCQGSYSARQKLQLCCQWKNRLEEEEIIKNTWASTSDTAMPFQCCRQQAVRQLCHVACLSFQYSALTANPFARLKESRNPAETLKRLITKEASLLMQGGTLLFSSAMFYALGNSFDTWGALPERPAWGVAVPCFFILLPLFAISFFPVFFKLVEFSNLHTCFWKIHKYICQKYGCLCSSIPVSIVL